MRHFHKGSLEAIRFWRETSKVEEVGFKLKLTNYTVRPITSTAQAEKSSLKGGDRVPVLKIQEVFNPRLSVKGEN